MPRRIKTIRHSRSLAIGCAILLGLMSVMAQPQSQAPQVRPSQPQSEPRYRTGSASRDGIGKFYYQREIAQVMGFEGAEWLERADRGQEERPDLLVKALHLAPGMNIADIGAGSGYLSKRMAPLVAPGAVLAVDVQPQMVALLRTLSAQPGLGNIMPVLGSSENVNLQKNSIDLAIMVDTYHELSEPYEIVSSVIEAMKSGGRLVLVEYRGEDPSVHIKPLHKMTVAQVRRELQQFPLTVERIDERLPIQHILVFKKN